MRIAVAGGTGMVGRHVVRAAAAAGHDPVALSRSSGVDVRTGEGLDEALAGADVIVDVTNAGTTNGDKATAFFTEVAGRLQRAGAAAGVRHLVVLSIVGVDKAGSSGYYGAKLKHEEAAKGGSIAVSVLRATQFHEFAGQWISWTKKGPLVPVTRMPVQTVAAATVGTALAELALGAPRPDTVELAGPEKAQFADLVRAVLHHQGQSALVVPLPVPGAAGRAIRRGALLAGPGTRIEVPTFS
ncbi:MAG TPA: NAD(P)H-binding protein, partial [Acidimicrobiales bacterium]|nr:NAD(P)H-binding protein [Acidimicrobiales bacterium]